uniref:Replication modulator SeqA C-terminal DNA-binding domain-containing protein n=1 Tax=Ignavibacterium album TaxID=591197 RepID=A0A832DJ27_9BACT
METNSYSELKEQLLTLEQIKNPSKWVSEAIYKLRIELKKIENQNRHLSQIESAKNEIELIKSKYKDLEIIYSINEKKTSTQPTIRIPQIDTGVRVVTHLSALNKDYTFKKPRSFVFNNSEYTSFINSFGQKINIKDWKDILEGVCDKMQELHPNEINRVLNLRGRTRLYFAQSKSQLSSLEARNAPRRIKNTNIYIETNYPANVHVERSYQVIELFGHERSELNFITYQ